MGIEDAPQVPGLTRLEAVRLSAQRKLVRDPVCSTKGREDKFCLRRGMERRDRQLEGACSAARSEADNTSFSTSDIHDADSENSSRGQPTCPKVTSHVRGPHATHVFESSTGYRWTRARIPSGGPNFGRSNILRFRWKIVKAISPRHFVQDQLPHCDGTFLDAGVRLVRDEDCLNGPQRLVADGFLTQEECATLLKLSETAISGSGYGKRFPNTKYEDFSGVTLKNLKQQLKESTIDVSAAKLVLLTADRSRLYVEAYFRLKQRLHAHFVHLACRNATERSTTNRTDMSHVIHSDNCQFQQNGSCPAIRKDLVAREFSAAVYLNADVHGGEMVLAMTPRTSIRAVIPPKCGRIVALNSRNPHGVLPVFRGRRCALLTWMTYQRDVEDPDLSECRKMLGFDDGYSPNVGQYSDAYKSG
ncbi:prolyl 3-hydroxylase 3 [Rhipicephalus microplus]|uniref:prolyl 3-hydroxylase 3 n=1 Tax=Rhipicephalus microplus TaxID=6941 RepID=UPI003F6B82A2